MYFPLYLKEQTKTQLQGKNVASHLLKRGGNIENDGFGHLDYQSAFCCFPIKYIVGHRSSEFLSEIFKKKYQHIMATAAPREDKQNIILPEYKHFLVSCPADLKLAWLATKKGGAAKQKECFCCCCMQTSSYINVANSLPCVIMCNDLVLSENIIHFPNCNGNVTTKTSSYQALWKVYVCRF